MLRAEVVCLLVAISSVLGRRSADEYRVSAYAELSGLSPSMYGAGGNGRPARYSKQSYAQTDFLGAFVEASHDVEVHDDVLLLHHHAGVEWLECPTAGVLLVGAASASRMLADLEDDSLLILGAGWGCNRVGSSSPPTAHTGPDFQLEPDGDEMAVRIVEGGVRVQSLTDAAQPYGPGVVAVTIIPASLLDAFISLKASFTRTQPAGAPAFSGTKRVSVPRHHHSSTFNNATTAPALSPYQRGHRALQQATTSGCDSYTGLCSDYSFDYTYSYALVNWNFNTGNNCGAMSINDCDYSAEPQLNLLDGGVLTCTRCFLYLGAYVHFSIDIGLGYDLIPSLNHFVLSASAGPYVSVDIGVNIPSSYSSQTTHNLMPKTLMFPLTIPLGVFGFTIDVYSSLDLELTLSSSTGGRIVGPGFWFQDSITIGISYDGSQWQDLSGSTVVFNSRAPSISLPVSNTALSASLSASLVATITFGLFEDVWALSFSPTPSLSVDVTYNSRCPGGSLSMVYDYGLQLSVDVEPPTISIAGYKMTIPTGGFLPYRTTLDIVPPTPFSCAGCSGCVDGSSATGSSSGGGGGTAASASATTSPWPVGSAAPTPSSAGCNYLDEYYDLPAAWYVGAWGGCQGTCGTGVQTRPVACINCADFYASNCAGAPPQSTQVCSLSACPSVSPGPASIANYAPSHVALPSGSMLELVYSPSPTVTYFLVILQVLLGTADLHLSVNPSCVPSACCVYPSWGLCAQTCLYGSVCAAAAGGLEIMNLMFAGSPFPVAIYAQGTSVSPAIATVTAVGYYFLTSSVPVVMTAVTGDQQLFVFASQPDASGFVVFADVSPSTPAGDPDVYVSAFNYSSLPSITSYTASAVSAGPDSLTLYGTSLFQVAASYAVMVRAYAGGSYIVSAADIYQLQPGVPLVKSMPSFGLTYFYARLPPDTDRVDVLLTNIQGDADLYYSNAPFRPLGAGYSCNCVHASENAGDDWMHLDFTDPAWSLTMYFAVVTNVPGVNSTFSITLFPYVVLGEAVVNRLSVGFGAGAYLLFGEGRSPGATYYSEYAVGATGAFFEWNNGDAFRQWVTSSIPGESEVLAVTPYGVPSSFLQQCYPGQRRLLDGEHDSAQRAHNSLPHDRRLSFESTGIPGINDVVVLGGGAGINQGSAANFSVTAMALQAATSFPSCFANAAAAWHVSMTFPGANAARFVSLQLSQAQSGAGLVNSPMGAVLTLDSITTTTAAAGSRRRLGEDDDEVTAAVFPSPPSSFLPNAMLPPAAVLRRLGLGGAAPPTAIEPPFNGGTASSPTALPRRGHIVPPQSRGAAVTHAPGAAGWSQRQSRLSSVTDHRAARRRSGGSHTLYMGSTPFADGDGYSELRAPVAHVDGSEAILSSRRHGRRKLQGSAAASYGPTVGVYVVSPTNGTRGSAAFGVTSSSSTTAFSGGPGAVDLSTAGALAFVASCNSSGAVGVTVPCAQVVLPAASSGLPLSLALQVPVAAVVSLTITAALLDAATGAATPVSITASYTAVLLSNVTQSDGTRPVLRRIFDGTSSFNASPAGVLPSSSSGATVNLALSFCETATTLSVMPAGSASPLTNPGLLLLDVFPLATVPAGLASALFPPPPQLLQVNLSTVATTASSASCPYFYFSTGSWSACVPPANGTCASTTGSMNRSVACFSGAGVPVPAGPFTCPGAPPPASLICTRSATCTATGSPQTVTSGSLLLWAR